MITEQLDSIIEQLGVLAYDLEGRETFISGASGFLGSWMVAVIDRLNTTKFTKPATVYALDSFIATDRKNMIATIESDHIFFRKGDVAQTSFSTSDKIDYIIHAAGIASPIFYRQYPIETIDGMVMGLSKLLKFAADSPVRGFLNFSSSEIYGNPTSDQVPTKETYYGNVSCIGPRSCYDESKRMGEAMCVSYNRIHNIPVTSVRPFNVYGPGMRVRDDRVIPKFTYQILKNDPLTVHVPGIQTRTFCYITDAIVGFFKALLSGKRGEVYNIGNNVPEVSVADLAKFMVKLFNSKTKIIEIPMPSEYPTDQAQRRCPDLTKALTDLEYRPGIDLETGLQFMYLWAQVEVHRAA